MQIAFFDGFGNQGTTDEQIDNGMGIAAKGFLQGENISERIKDDRDEGGGSQRNRFGRPPDCHEDNQAYGGLGLRGEGGVCRRDDSNNEGGATDKQADHFALRGCVGG